MKTLPKNPVNILILLISTLMFFGNSYSQPVSHRLFVDINNNSGIEDGSQLSPYNTIQEAINASPDGDTVIVLPGTYFENVEVNFRNLVLGSRYMDTEDPAYITSTIIDGNNTGKALFFRQSTGTIEGFTMQHGLVNDYGGGGIHTLEADVVISNCFITDNHHTLAENYYAGGLACMGGNVTIDHCTVTGNTSVNGTGAIVAGYGNINIMNSLMTNNSGVKSFDFSSEAGNIINTTLAGNYGLFSAVSSAMTIQNCIVWNTTSESNDLGMIGTVNYTNSAYLMPGTGNTAVNPLFQNPALGDYHLRLGSPCIDAGNPDPSYNDPDDTRNDMGFYGGPQGTSYTYNDAPPIIEEVILFPNYVGSDEAVNITVRILDLPSSVTSVSADIENPDENVVISASLFDDGMHNDYSAEDGYFGNSIIHDWPEGEHMLVDITATDNNTNVTYADNAAGFDVIPVPDTVHLPFITDPVVIDGSSADNIWTDIDPLPIAKLQFGNIDGPEDMSASFKACWDLDSLYLFVDVTDDSLDNLHGERDQVRLFLNMENSRDRNYDMADWMIRIYWEGPVLCDRSLPGIHVIQHTNDTRDGYQMEMSISLKDLGFPMTELVGLDLRVTDNDGENTVTSTSAWNSAIFTYSFDDRLYGVAQLVDYAENLPPQGIKITALDNFPSCAGSSGPITVRLTNFGTETIDQFQISYSINGVAIDPAETVMMTIAPKETVVYTFSTPPDLSATGNYSVYITTLLNGGDPHANLSLETLRFVFGTDPYEDWTVYSVCSGLPSNYTRSVIADQEDNIWVGSSYGEVSKLNKTTGEWTVFNGENSGLTGNATALLEDSNGNIWVALDWGYSKFDGVSWTNYTDIAHVLSIFEDHEGYIWLGGWGSDVTRMDPVSHAFTTYTTSNSGIAGNILWDDAMMEDADHNLWIGTLGGYGDTGGLSKFDGFSWTNYNTGNSGIPSNHILCTAMDNQGNIWLGFGWRGYGIAKFDGSTWTTYDLSNSSIISNRIYSIHADRNGNIWCGSDVGLSKFDGTAWENFTTENSGLTDNYISKITEDAGGNIWIATSNGLCKYTPQMPHFEAVWSGNGMDHMNFYAMSAQIDGVDMQPGDEIGIFDGDLCVGTGVLTAVLNGTNYFEIRVSRDDPETPQLDGYTTGHQAAFKLWDASEQRETADCDITYLIGNNTLDAGASCWYQINGTSQVTQVIPLLNGWNIFSLNVVPDNIAMISIVQSLIDAGSLVKIQNETGAAIEPLPMDMGWINNIGNWSMTEGYKIRVNQTTSLTVSGTPISEPVDINLLLGWNIIGYPASASQGALSILDPLIVSGNLMKVQDETGAAIEPMPMDMGWINNIGDFEPGEGYKVRVASDGNLTIGPSGTGGLKSTRPVLAAPQHFKRSWEGNGYDHMNVYLTLSSNDFSLFSPVTRSPYMTAHYALASLFSGIRISIRIYSQSPCRVTIRPQNS